MQIISAQGIEFALIGLVTALLAVGIGALGAWAIVTFLLQTDFVFSVPAAAIPAGLALALAVSQAHLAFGARCDCPQDRCCATHECAC